MNKLWDWLRSDKIVVRLLVLAYIVGSLAWIAFSSRSQATLSQEGKDRAALLSPCLHAASEKYYQNWISDVKEIERRDAVYASEKEWCYSHYHSGYQEYLKTKENLEER